MEIKTIVSSMTWVGNFDEMVNDALAEGWRLTRRDVLPNTDRLYAELVKLDPPAEPEKSDLLTAMRVIKAECDSHSSCQTCPLYPWCDVHAPCDWETPEEVQNDG